MTIALLAKTDFGGERDEDGQGWTTIALDRKTREWAVAQRKLQLEPPKPLVAFSMSRSSRRRTSKSEDLTVKIRQVLSLCILVSSTAVGWAQSAVWPPSSAGHVLLYHPKLEKVLLVNAGLGAADDSATLAKQTKLWAWDGAKWTVLDANGPPPRNMSGVAYDAARDVVVLHGGASGGKYLDDTWEWSRGLGWRQIKAPGPGIRHHTQMTYDPIRRECVLYGGIADKLDVFLDDVWTWNGKAWRQIRAAGPGGRVHHAMAFDPVSSKVVLFGGFVTGMKKMGDSWAWDGRAWIPLDLSGSPRSQATLVHNPSRRTLMLVGGISQTEPASVALMQTSQGWQRVELDSGPPERFLTGAAFDLKRGALVVFGGGGDNGLYNDLWELGDRGWRKVH